MEEHLNLPVPDLGVLERLAASRRVVRLSGGPSTYLLFRDTYFDTADGILVGQGLTLRLRAEARGRQLLQLSWMKGINLQGIAEAHVIETPVVGGGAYATLLGGSEVATRVRGLVVAAALRPSIAIDVDREIRDLRAGFWGAPTHRITFDQMIAHSRDGSRATQEVTLVRITSKGPKLETLAERLRRGPGLATDGLGTYQRVLAELTDPSDLTRTQVPFDVEVAPIVMIDGRVCLVEGDQGLSLPVARGSGEELARECVAEILGSGGDAVESDLIGFVPMSGGRPDLEVWLHELPLGERDLPAFSWMPFLELLERVGGPGLRDPALSAALLLLVRSDIGRRLLREQHKRGAEPTWLPVAERPGERLLDLELSILDFNQRVLELAEDASIPLLERFFYLSIFSSNLDEFFVVRVGRLKEQAALAKVSDDAEGLSAHHLLQLVAIRVRALLARQDACMNQHLLPALADRGIRLRHWEDLPTEDRKALCEVFQRDLFPLLTPLSLSASPGRSFPRLPSLGLSLAAVLRRPDGKVEYGYLELSDELPRFLEVPGGRDLIRTSEVVIANASSLFTSMEVQGVYVFRVSRVSDVDVEDQSTGSLLSAVADEVEERPFKPVIRIEVQSTMPREVRAYLLKELRVEAGNDGVVLGRGDMYEVDGPIGLDSFSRFLSLDVPGGRFPPYEPRRPLEDGRSIFDILSERDVLVHRPFDDFDATVGRFLREAAADPDVASIKLTLYRTGRDSPVVQALLSALEAGKEVTLFVELKARFDEENNIEWTRRLTAAGAHVVYGVVGYKTHAKTTLVVRKEAGGVRRYVHIGTGNYNGTTARFYTDVGLLSADPDLGADLSDFFNELTGSAGPPEKQFRRLLVAPHSLVQGIGRMIEREIQHAEAGRPARIQAKLNGLSDEEVVEALYKASQAGVKIDLIVRSICTLRPGVPGLSDGIEVRSILGRFLEHSRVIYFENAGQSEYYIGSADWRARNLRRRVEVVTAVDDPAARRVLRGILDAQLADPTAWLMRADGVFARLAGDGPTSQERFMRHPEGH